MNAIYLTLLAATVTFNVPTEYRTVSGRMEKSSSLCTGVYIAPDKVLTAGHCLDDVKGPITLKTSDNKYDFAFVEKLNLAFDLGLLRTVHKHKGWVKLGQYPRIADTVYTVDSGNGVERTWNVGYVKNITKIDKDDKILLIFTSLLIRQGASGSGLFNEKKELIGINIIKEGVGSWAVNTSTIRKFLNVAKAN